MHFPVSICLFMMNRFMYSPIVSHFGKKRLPKWINVNLLNYYENTYDGLNSTDKLLHCHSWLLFSLFYHSKHLYLPFTLVTEIAMPCPCKGFSGVSWIPVTSVMHMWSFCTRVPSGVHKMNETDITCVYSAIDHSFLFWERKKIYQFRHGTA